MATGIEPHTRREQILQAAARLFSERGYHATTMRELARALQLEGGSLYSHISGKEELLYEIVLASSERFVRMGRQVLAAGGSARARLHTLMRGHLELVAESSDHAVVYFHDWRHLEPQRRAGIQHLRDEYDHLVGQLISEGVAQGEFCVADARLARLFVLSLLNWSYQWYRPDGACEPHELADRFFEMAMSGLTPRSGAPPT